MFKVWSPGDVYSQHRVQQVVEPIRNRRRQCEKCVDPYWSALWMQRLLDNRPGVPEQAYCCVCDQLALAPVCSVRVEMRHVLGQMLKPVRTRARAPSTTALAHKTYMGTAREEHGRKRDNVISEVLGGNDAKRCFSNLLNIFEIGSTRRRRTATGHVISQATVSEQASTAYSRAIRGYDVFVRERYNTDLVQIDFAERRRVDDAWKVCNMEHKYHGRRTGVGGHGAGVWATWGLQL